MNEPLHRALGLTDDEAVNIDEILDRPANPLELAMYSVMWSEHCSYKSSRIHLKRLPTEALWELVGPGENAGVVTPRLLSPTKGQPPELAVFCETSSPWALGLLP